MATTTAARRAWRMIERESARTGIEADDLTWDVCAGCGDPVIFGRDDAFIGGVVECDDCEGL